MVPADVVQQFESFVGEVHRMPGVQVDVIGGGGEHHISDGCHGKPQSYRRVQAPLRAVVVPHLDKVAEPVLEHLRPRLSTGQRLHDEPGRFAGAFPGHVHQPLVQRPLPVILVQLRKDVGHAGQHAHGRAPSIGRVFSAEPGPDAKSHAVVAASRLKAKDCLGDYQPDIVLHTVLETGRPMRYLIPRRGLRVNPDYAVGYAYRIAADVVGEGIEGAAAGQIEPCVMPVAGEDAILDASPVQGKAHVRAPVVHREQLAVVVEHHDSVTAAGDHRATAGFDFIRGSRPYMSGHGRGHDNTSSGDSGNSSAISIKIRQ